MFAQAMTRTNSWVFPLILWLMKNMPEKTVTHTWCTLEKKSWLCPALLVVLWWPKNGGPDGTTKVAAGGKKIESQWVALQLQLGQGWREPLCGPSLSRQSNVKWGERACLWAHIDLGSNSRPVIYYCVTLSKFFIFLVLIFFICEIRCCATSSPNSSEVFIEITHVQCLHTDQR